MILRPGGINEESLLQKKSLSGDRLALTSRDQPASAFTVLGVKPAGDSHLEWLSYQHGRSTPVLRISPHS